MAQTIKLKRSATQGAAPTTSNLALGEVAINTYDGKMYIKKDVGGTESIVEVGSGANTVSYLEAGMIEYEYTATSNQTTFSGSDSNSATLSYTANSIMVFLNGVLQDDGVDYTATNGTSVVFGTGLVANDEVRIVAFTNVTTNRSLQDPTKLDAITTVNAQAAYSLTLNSSAYTPSSQNALIVSLNGITQEPGDSFTISGSTITFSPALVTGDVVDYIVDMGRAVTIGEYSGDLAVGGELEVTGDIIGDIRGSVLFKAQAGESLAKGDVVYISGISGNTTVVSKADADDAAKMPAFGVVADTASSGNPVDIYTFGTLSGLDTSSFSEGDELFVSTTAGTLTNSAPAGESAQIQKIAKVTRSHNSSGSIKIMGAGRSNATPNLDNGNIFIGNASNQAVTASLNTKIEDYLDGGTSTPSFSTINSGNITTTGYIAGPSTFTIDPAAVGDNTGTLVVAGNLQVDGTTTTINSTTMTVDDLNITLASGAANAAAANGAGITVDGASATLTYNSTPDAWSFNKNVGIGTSSPDSILHLSGSSASRIIIEDSANPRGNYIGINSSDNLVIAADEDNLGSSSTIQFRVDGSERMRIDSSGRLLLGITSSVSVTGGDRQFQISGTNGVTSSAVIRRSQNSSGAPSLSLAKDRGSVSTAVVSGDALGAIYFSGSDGTDLQNDAAAIIGWADGTPSSNSTPGRLAFYTNNGGINSTERMRINSSGNVGIGTTNPSNLLHVDKDTGSTPTVYINNSGPNITEGVALKVQASGRGTGVADASIFSVHNNTTELFTVRNDGNIGIGTSSPVGNLHVTNGSSGGFLQLGTNAGANTYQYINFGGEASGHSAWQIGKADQSGNVAPSSGFYVYDLASNFTSLAADTSGNWAIGTITPNSYTGYKALTLNGSTGGIIDFESNGTLVGEVWAASTTSFNMQTVGASTDMGFRTNGTERIRITSDGDLWFNSTTNLTSAGLSAGETGIVARAADLFIISRDGGAGLLVNRKTSNGAMINFRKDGTTVGDIGSEGGDSIYIGNGDTGLKFSGGSDIIQPFNTSTVAARDAGIDLGNSGARFKDIYLSGGAYLGGTGSANYLDDYEEGTWTPALYGSTTAGTQTQPNSSYQTTPFGYYTKIGNRVMMTAHFSGVALTNATGFLNLSGFPFTFTNVYGWSTYLEGFDPAFNKSLGGSNPTNHVILRGSGTTASFGPAHSYAWDTYLSASTTLWNGGGNGVHGQFTFIGYIA